jgi:hypothetical protein
MGRDAGKGYGTGYGKSIRKYRERRMRADGCERRDHLCSHIGRGITPRNLHIHGDNAVSLRTKQLGWDLSRNPTRKLD